MKHHLSKAMLLLAGAAVVASVAAPAAQARPGCKPTANAGVTCQTNGSVSIKHKPRTTAPRAVDPPLPWLVNHLPFAVQMQQ